jgi:hypothetical protein
MSKRTKIRVDPDPYASLQKALEGVGLVGQRRGADQLIVSSQEAVKKDEG